jgi:hypothetical protein
MADTIVDIDFTNVGFNLHQVTGSLQVDYTTNMVTGSLTVPYLGIGTVTEFSEEQDGQSFFICWY